MDYSAEWVNEGGTIGYVTLARSGGNIAERLTVWFEPEGVALIAGYSVGVVVGATADIPLIV